MPPKYVYLKFLLVQFYLLMCAQFGWSAYIIPELSFQAINPSGFHVSIPDEPGIKHFAFHGRINGPLSELEPGELSKEVRKPTNGRWVYEDPDVKLRVGDSIGYWVFVQHDFYGYRKENLTWRVEVLRKKGEIPEPEPNRCEKTITIVNGKPSCKGKLIFEETFNRLDQNKWAVEKYIPRNGPNYEFNYYSPESVTVEDNKLQIRPYPAPSESDIRGKLDLSQGCTSPNPDECSYTQHGGQYLPPVKSGKIKSKFTFKFGRIEIDAKLPCGDWIVPEISLIPRSNQYQSIMSKIDIAYSRGNSVFRSASGNDTGGTLLFSGYSATREEPQRSEFLASKRINEPYCRKNHKFTVVWGRHEILSYLDNESVPFGQISMWRNTEMQTFECFICLGVSIGGNNDFPNDFTSIHGNPKPWRNKDVLQIGKFFMARDKWLPTWSLESSLDVNSVRVYAL